jgi:hypothetical protein
LAHSAPGGQNGDLGTDSPIQGINVMKWILVLVVGIPNYVDVEKIPIESEKLCHEAVQQFQINPPSGTGEAPMLWRAYCVKIAD